LLFDRKKLSKHSYRMRAFSFSCLVLAAACGTPSPSLPPVAVEAVNPIAAAAIAFDPSATGPLPPEVAIEVDRAFEEHQVLALGEGDHFIREKYDYRLALLRHLVERHGVRHVSLEMGASDAGRLDRYLETGDDAWLHRVVLYGYRGDTEDERRELGPVTQATRRPCDDAWAEAERAFFRELRSISVRALASRGERIHLHGFDYDAAPGGGFADARDALASCTTSEEATKLRADVTPPRGTSAEREIVRLEGLVARIDAVRATLDAACGAPNVETARAALEQLVFSYRTFFEWHASMQDRSPDGPARVHRMFVAREARMAASLSRWRANLRAGERVVLLAHDLHVARDSEVLRYGPASHDGAMWTSLGTYIAREQPGSIWVAWLLYGEGTRYAPSKEECSSTVSLRPLSLEATLRHVGGAYYLPLTRVASGAVVDQAVPFGTETSEGSGPVRSSVDAIVFLPRASAPR
jgi:erythromycin esterase-like protein